MMSEFKGTKWPWKVLNEDDFIVVHENDESVTFVAACVDDEHDAHLIAAAPDLLEALQCAISHVREQAKSDAHAFGVLQACNRAIAKALGETK